MRRHKSPIGEHGFTLLELLVVLTIMGVVMAVGMPQIGRSVERARLRQLCDRVAAELRKTQAAAMRSGEVTKFMAVQIPSQAGTEGTRVEIHASGARALDAQAIGFYPDGSSSGGVLDLWSGAQHARITVDWVTGRADADVSH